MSAQNTENSMRLNPALQAKRMQEIQELGAFQNKKTNQKNKNLHCTIYRSISV